MICSSTLLLTTAFGLASQADGVHRDGHVLLLLLRNIPPSGSGPASTLHQPPVMQNPSENRKRCELRLQRLAVSSSSSTEAGTSSYSARRSSSAISTVTSRDQPSALNATAGCIDRPTGSASRDWQLLRRSRARPGQASQVVQHQIRIRAPHTAPSMASDAYATPLLQLQLRLRWPPPDAAAGFWFMLRGSNRTELMRQSCATAHAPACS
jgi:hypothetical protein